MSRLRLKSFFASIHETISKHIWFRAGIYPLAIGIALSFSQPPYKYLSFLVLIAVAGFFHLATFIVQRKRFALIAWAFAWTVYATLMCTWIVYFGVVALLAFALAEFLLGLLFAYLVKLSSPDKVHALTIAFLWVAFEWIQTHLGPLSFPWLTLATTISSENNNISNFLVRLGGGAALTFYIVAFVGVFYYFVTKRIRRPRTLETISLLIVSVIFLLAIGSSVVNSYKIGSDARDYKRVTIVQGNNLNRYLTDDEIQNEYLTESHLKLARSIPPYSYDSASPDIIVFPESAFDTSPEEDPQLKKELAKVASKAGSYLVVNAIVTEDGEQFNRNFIYDPYMRLKGTYDKKRLVPFGEYVPGESLIGKWSIFNQIGRGFSPGKTSKNTETVGEIATLICFESTFTEDVRNAVSKDTRLIVVTTNNRSYRTSRNSAQHIALTQLRAKEYGLSMIHASVSGSSVLISSSGKIEEKSKMFKNTVLTGTVSVKKPNSFYAKTFDWLSYLSLIVVGYQYLVAKRISKWRNRT